MGYGRYRNMTTLRMSPAVLQAPSKERTNTTRTSGLVLVSSVPPLLGKAVSHLAPSTRKHNAISSESTPE
ncbi:hypothetical protein M378DRAFT_156550 [Amanita muscaria Koide BX008]|uniref:Uncharacterized protein n=1 Tax=Amanita muscaria (strain Koide BX008) TaxID=946122 RepID=A0A0C2T3H3_AMAMK|nr:hypothetical protein M378DRAFT_156550 [Amanita muscaria Koide BX008]